MCRTRFVVFVVALAIGSFASADVIFNGGLPNPMTGGGLSDLDSDARQGDDFTLTAGASTVTGVRWYGFYISSPPAMDDFSIWIYETTVGAPNAMPAHMLSIVDVGRMMESDYFVYEASFAPIALSPGMTYVISIFNNTPPGFDDDWSWYTSGEGTGFGWLGDTLVEINRDFAFALLGPIVPAPSGVLMLAGAALAGYGVRSRRTKRG
jgi:hypothetical protein